MSLVTFHHALEIVMKNFHAVFIFMGISSHSFQSFDSMTVFVGFSWHCFSHETIFMGQFMERFMANSWGKSTTW